MKKSVWLVALLAAGLALTYGCGGSDGDSGGNSSIVGTWSLDDEPAVSFTFASGGAFSVSGEGVGVLMTGTWSTSGNTITLNIDDDEAASGVGTYSVSGNHLSVSSDGETRTFTRA